MATGSRLDELTVLADQAAACTRCPLAATRTQVVFGAGDPDAALMIVGEAPGRDEDRDGLPFVGRSGRLLDTLLADEVGIDRTQVYIANVIKCRPPDNRNPKAEEIAACRPYLDDQMALVAPTVVVTLGNFATKLLLATDLGITAVRGTTYPLGDTLVVPTFHPAAALRGSADVLAHMRDDFARVAQLIGRAA